MRSTLYEIGSDEDQQKGCVVCRCDDEDQHLNYLYEVVGGDEDCFM